MTAETIVGVSDEQLAALNKGRWVDDRSSAPGWERWITVTSSSGGGGGGRVKQCVFPYPPYFTPPSTSEKWKATSGPDENIWTDTLESALQWCNDRAGGREINQPVGTSTRQEDRFVERAGGAGWASAATGPEVGGGG